MSNYYCFKNQRIEKCFIENLTIELSELTEKTFRTTRPIIKTDGSVVNDSICRDFSYIITSNGVLNNFSTNDSRKTNCLHIQVYISENFSINKLRFIAFPYKTYVQTALNQFLKFQKTFQCA